MNDNKKNVVKKFAVLGVLTCLTLYGTQAIGVAGFNEFSRGQHDAKMIATYTKIWKEIDNRDVSAEIQEYKELANNIPSELRVGLIVPQKTEKRVDVSERLPSAENVEIEALALNDRTKFKFR